MQEILINRVHSPGDCELLYRVMVQFGGVWSRKRNSQCSPELNGPVCIDGPLQYTYIILDYLP